MNNEVRKDIIKHLFDRQILRYIDLKYEVLEKRNDEKIAKKAKILVVEEENDEEEPKEDTIDKGEVYKIMKENLTLNMRNKHRKRRKFINRRSKINLADIHNSINRYQNDTPSSKFTIHGSNERRRRKKSEEIQTPSAKNIGIPNAIPQSIKVRHQ